MDKIKVTKEDFDISKEIEYIKKNNKNIGAIVSFIGAVRDIEESKLKFMNLEHYPKMTEKSLKEIVLKAKKRWHIFSTTIIHRVGELKINDQIVLVITTSKHRQDAFDSCNFIIDYLKTDAPFWKKESTNNNDYWVKSKVSDIKKKKQWKY